MKTYILIKPTKHNKKVLQDRGLFSDDSRYLFACYEEILEDREYKLRLSGGFSDAALADEFMDIGLKF